MNQDFRVINLQQIEKNSQYDIHSFLQVSCCNSTLIESIKKIGILTPPVLIEKDGDGYESICGRRRIECARTLNATYCYCQILDKRCREEVILTIILEDQFSSGPLTPVEQAWFIRICSKLLPDKKRRNSFFQSLLPGRITKGLHYLSQLSELEMSIQSAIHLGTLSDRILKEICSFSSNEQHLLLNFIESLHLGGNNQKKLVVQLRDILKRESISLKTFIESNGIREIMSNGELDRNERASRILEFVKCLHQPLLTSAQYIFEQQIKTLKLPDGITVAPTHSFEKDEVTLSVQFRSLKLFKKKWEDIARYLNDLREK